LLADTLATPNDRLTAQIGPHVARPMNGRDIPARIAWWGIRTHAEGRRLVIAVIIGPPTARRAQPGNSGALSPPTARSARPANRAEGSAGNRGGLGPEARRLEWPARPESSANDGS